MDIPSPFLQGADETSIQVSFEPTENLFDAGTLYLQYKLPHVEWDKAAQAPVEYDISTKDKEPKISVLVADLLPGTPYVTRLMLVSKANSSDISYGPEVVFDTAPIGCTPKKKRQCSIS